MRALQSSSQTSADPAPIWLADTPTLADDDPMAQVLPWLVRHLGMAETLADEAGLDAAACEARPGRLLQSLQQLGFDTRLIHDPVTALCADDLPAVLRLRSGDACVLTALQGPAGLTRRCHVVVLAPEPMSFTVSDADLARECAGPALLVRRPARRPATAPATPSWTSPPSEAPRPPAPALRADEPPAVLLCEPVRPLADTLLATPPVAVEQPSALSQALAARRVAQARSAESRRTSEPAAPTVPPGLLDLPTLDDVIAPDELACLAHLAERPGRVAAWARSAPARPAATGPVAATPTVTTPVVTTPVATTPAVTAPAVTAPVATAPAPSDTGADVVLDLGFLDRQTGAGRLRGRVEQWQQQLRLRWARLGEIGRAASLHALAGPRPPRRTGPPAASHIPSRSPSRPDELAGLPAVAAVPARRSGWRPPFGLGWPLGQALSRAEAANTVRHGRAPAPSTVRREPTLAAVPAAAMAHARAEPIASSSRAGPSVPPDPWDRGDEAGSVHLSPRSVALAAGEAADPPTALRQTAALRAATWVRPARAVGAWLRHRSPAPIDLAGLCRQAVVRSGGPRLAAAWQRWRRSARLERWLEAPLLAACGAVCLLDGLPLAWARMVSVSGMKAAASVLPVLMRHALAADQDRAAAALGGAPPGQQITERPARAGSPPRGAVPAAANAPRLAAVTPAADAGAGTAGRYGGGFTGPSTLAMVAARAEKAQRARVRGIDVATTLRRRSEALSMGPPPPPARPRRALTAGVALMAA